MLGSISNDFFCFLRQEQNSVRRGMLFLSTQRHANLKSFIFTRNLQELPRPFKILPGEIVEKSPDVRSADSYLGAEFSLLFFRFDWGHRFHSRQLRHQAIKFIGKLFGVFPLELGGTTSLVTS